MKKIASALLMALSVMLFASTAFAQAADPGLDARLSLTGSVLKVDTGTEFSGMGMTVSDESDEMVDYAGLSFKLSAGYRWQYYGIYLDQDLGGVWYNDKGKDEMDDKGRFLGGTYVVFRGIYAIMPNFSVDLGFGLGVMYSGGNKAKDMEDMDDPSDYRSPVIFDKNNDPSAAFAMKLSLGLTYFFSPSLGAGINLDYNIGLKTLKNEAFGGESKMKFRYHQINPGLQLVARF